jgi:hypothetical protein
MRIARPNDNDTARGITATTAFDAGAGTEPGYSQAHDAVDLVDPLLLDLRDEHWMSQSTRYDFSRCLPRSNDMKAALFKAMDSIRELVLTANNQV